MTKKQLQGPQTEAAIMQALMAHPECSAITHVYVKGTGRKPPEDTWTHSLISRQPISPRLPSETSKLHEVLNQLRKEIDLIGGD